MERLSKKISISVDAEECAACPRLSTPGVNQPFPMGDKDILLCNDCYPRMKRMCNQALNGLRGLNGLCAVERKERDVKARKQTK